MTCSIVSAINLDSFGIVIRKVLDGGKRLMTSTNGVENSAGDNSVHGV